MTWLHASHPVCRCELPIPTNWIVSLERLNRALQHSHSGVGYLGLSGYQHLDVSLIAIDTSASRGLDVLDVK